jgi:rod shape determining protein RodA
VAVGASLPRRAVGAGTSGRTNLAAAWRHVDISLVLTSLAVAGLGLVMIYSATRTRLAAQGINPHYYVERQAIFVAIGVLAMLLCAAVDYRVLLAFSPVVYVGTVLSLLAVLSPVGSRSKGAQAWFQLGSYQFEPSEVAKVALIICLAAYCASHRGELNGRRLLVVLGLGAVPFALVYVQPNLGTSLILLALLLSMLLIGGARPRHLLGLTVLGVLGIVMVLQLGVLKQYQVQRLTAFLDTKSNTQGSTYNLHQSQIAIANGATFGRGLFRGTQTNLAYVPEQHTDFIFTAVGEQLGFVGSATLLALFGLMVWRTWRIATLAKDLAGTLLCVGVLAILVFQIFVNVGMTMGIMPITGIPLPFMSYGGTATVAAFAAIGLVLNVHMRRFA